MRARTVLEGVTDKAKEKLFHIREPHKDFEETYNTTQITEKIIYDGFDMYGNPAKIIKNPKNLKRIKSDARAIATKGDLYVLATGTLTHSGILRILGGDLKELIFHSDWWQRVPSIYGYISLQRVDDTNTFAVGESQAGDLLNPEYYPKNLRIFQEFNYFLDNIREKFPQYKFIARGIWHLDDREYEE